MIFSIGGQIGVGKSTIIEKIKTVLDNKNFFYLSEPVEQWKSITDKDGINPLEHFYKNPKQYAFNFQILAFITRLTQLQNAKKQKNEPEFIFTERSLEEDKYVFAELLHEEGFINEIEFRSYSLWFESQAVLPDFNIFLKASPEVCFERIKNRNRPEELTITLDYLKSLDKKYQDLLTKTKRKYVVIHTENKEPGEIACEVIQNIFIYYHQNMKN